MNHPTREWACEGNLSVRGFEASLNEREADGWTLNSWQANETDDGGPWIVAIWIRPIAHPEPER
jgi:hypothetical protein